MRERERERERERPQNQYHHPSFLLLSYSMRKNLQLENFAHPAESLKVFSGHTDQHV
jgi:hypothetical protein